MKMNKISSALILMTLSSVAQANNFNDFFCDSTLRIDYVFSGVPGDVGISLKGLSCEDGWHGRRNNLDYNHYIGNADVTVTSIEGDTLYTYSFSTLFNEWLDLNQTTPQAHESVVLVPYPRETVMVTTNIIDRYHKPIATIHHKVDPTDILIRKNPNAPLPHKYIREGNYDGHKISVAIMGEGYTANDMDTFYADAQATVDALLAHEPFGELKERFDFIAVETPSRQEGVSVPKNGEWKDSYFRAHYSTFYSDRYLTSDNIYTMHDALHGIPYEHIIILVNTEEYGGGGIYNNYTLTSAHHPTFAPVVVHEFGHSFGGLADEYFYDGDVMDNTYPTDSEPWEPNITALIDFASKWQSILPEGTPVPTPVEMADKYPVGVYEGAGYSFKGLYRPADYCRMRINEIDHFCPACQKALSDLIHYYTD